MVRRSRLSMPDRAVPPIAIRLTLAVALAVVLSATLALWAQPSPAWADDGVLARRVDAGGGVYPVTSSDIRMESETVQAICYRNFAEYRADFIFANDGQPQTLLLGFSSADIINPGPGGAQPTDLRADPGVPVALRAWQDGKPLKVTLGMGKDPMLSSAVVSYYLHTATFPHGQTMITVSYLAGMNLMLEDNTIEPGQSVAAYEYWLHTGAYWKGPIGKAIIRYRLADSFDGSMNANTTWAGEIRPWRYTNPDDRTYQWIFDNLEPASADDIFLDFTSPMITPLLSRFYSSYSDMAVPASAGAVAAVTAASERLGPNPDVETPPGWEAVDGNPATAWGFSAKARDKWLQIGVRGNQDLSEIRILPGRNDSPTSFTEYARPKTISVSWAGGASEEITLKDEPSLQRFTILGTVDNLTFNIEDVYPGTKSNDVYISEIDLGNVPAPEFDTFANMMAGGTPPTTEAVPVDHSSTSSSLPTMGSTSTATLASGTTLVSTTTAVTAPVATTGGPANPGGAGKGISPGLLWATIMLAVVAAIALGVSIYLAARLRRRSRAHATSAES